MAIVKSHGVHQKPLTCLPKQQSIGMGDHLAVPHAICFWCSPQLLPQLLHNLPCPLSLLENFKFQVCSISKKIVSECELLIMVSGKHTERRVFSASVILWVSFIWNTYGPLVYQPCHNSKCVWAVVTQIQHDSFNQAAKLFAAGSQISPCKTFSSHDFIIFTFHTSSYYKINRGKLVRA